MRNTYFCTSRHLCMCLLHLEVKKPLIILQSGKYTGTVVVDFTLWGEQIKVSPVTQSEVEQRDG